ncbi:peptide MFS transporter [Coxiella burnetii]|uniref:peptide MFS transporter n=1 Tax=Coxiella burnetii TaxID=777 RepID=UPI0005939580|nr:peptide MFS transporter [Coxiella burnetii]ATN73975.1 dipeptide/tripeptide permease [Coxiella burnetii]ATN75881.1 dipeptide/tripeptide permease [Coxiella burnetii]ATN77795.1 dipeptide/tripeptide permease [Coxiella burnetii]ATN79710.1 dipeptide/tripeptide permease [Coxiella burnetii]OYK92104.1 MFS transporter [Coxiella burnetii]
MLNYIPLVTQGLLMKQPRALTPLFLTEMWERFGFYVTQSLLILYITSVLNFSDSRAYMILGEFTALVYIAPLAGGFFADRVLGPRYAIFLGAIFLGLGYFFLGFAGQKLLFLSLSILVVGNGLLKPNISSFLGQFYYENDPRRDAGFTLFYIGINLGGLLALGSAGFIQEKLGWGAAFLSARVGMLIATVTFCFGFKKYENRGLPIPPDQIRPSFLRMTRHKLSIIFLILLTILIAYLLLSSTGIANLLQLVLGISILVTLLFVSSRFEKRIRNKFLVLIILILASIVFWEILFQAFASVNLFTQRVVDRHIVGLLIPSPAFISLETIFIILLGPFLAALWQRLHIKKLDPTPGAKFSFAMFSAAIAMTLLVLAVHWTETSGLIHPIWVVLFYLFLTLGEMLLSPIGLSMVTELSPPHLTGLMMGIWFMALGFGGQLSGFLAEQAGVPKYIVDIHAANEIYGHAFMNNAILSFVIGLILLILSPWLKRLMKN